ncbi:MAG: hypothetical protein Q8859_10570, partial [Bacteroidota bacterium]|nr:hypothetical protein [Bacteroidota bacterium]
ISLIRRSGNPEVFRSVSIGSYFYGFASSVPPWIEDKVIFPKTGETNEYSNPRELYNSIHYITLEC